MPGNYDRTHLKGPLTTKCRQCGETFAYKLYGEGRSRHYNRSQRFCSHACADAFQYRGGAVDKHGYRLQKKDGKYVPEHRLVMERHLGRNLTVHETVHHRDGNRQNNTLSNLELWTSRHGKGQRVEDLHRCVPEIIVGPMGLVA